MKHLLRVIDDNLLVTAALSFICGILLAPHLEPTATSKTQVALMLVFLLISLTVLQIVSKTRPLLLLFPLFFSVLGCFYTLLHLQVPTDIRHVYHQIREKSDLVVIGTMTAMAKYDGRTSQIPLLVNSLHESSSDRLTPATGTILVRLQGPWPEGYQPGNRLAVRGDFKRPTSYRTPGVFDYAQYLARRDIWVTGFVRSPSFLQKLPPIPSHLSNIKYLPERLRSRLGNHIDRVLGRESSGIYRAILIGDRSRVDDTILETFKGSGTMHILAISGIHVTIIGSLVLSSLFISFMINLLLLYRYVSAWID